MRQYHRMTYTDRLMIEKLYNSGCSYRAIAQRLGFSVSSIHYEVKRGIYLHRDGDTWKDVPRYSATIADDDAVWQATARGGIVKLGHNHDYAKAVSTRIRAGESPDAIVGSLRREHGWTVSTSTLYRYIDKGYIPNVSNNDLLRKNMCKKSCRHVRAARPPQGESIERRPEHINNRTAPGHWEMDSVIGKRSGKEESLLVLTERFTRFEIIVKMQDKTARSVDRALSKLKSDYPSGTFQTITVDNGSEFSDYSSIKRGTEEVYYCHPFSSWERGSNENCNKIIRRFFPKNQSMAHITQRDCDAAARFINNMHRKSLNYATAAELFHAWQETLLLKNF